VEANDHNHLMKLPEFYQGMTVKEDVIIYNGVKYLTLKAECHDEFDFVIYDMGVVNPKIISVIKNKCEAAVLCATGESYEIDNYEKVISLFYEDTINTLFSFVPEPIKVKLEKKYGKVYFSSYTPDFFDGETNETIWKNILSSFIKTNSIEEAM